MLRSILVPLDGSRLAERALAYATALSIPTAARLILVRAVQTHMLAGMDERSAQAKLVDEAETYLVEVAQGLMARGFDCDCATPYGHTPESIVEEVHIRDVDLIVMTSHGRTGPGRWVLGSVAEWVVAHSPVPVLLEPAWRPIRREPLLTDRPRILIPLDGSAFAESIIGPAGGFAEDLGAELTLLRVEAPPTRLLKDEVGRVLAYVDELEQAARISARDYLDGIAQRLRERQPGMRVASGVAFGDPAEAIGQAAAQTNAALIMMATHGRTGLLRSVLGSVAGRVLEHATVPLVLVRPVTSPPRAPAGAECPVVVEKRE